MSRKVAVIIHSVKNHQMYSLIRNSFYYGIGDIVQRFLALLLLPVYTRYLNPEDYGIIGLLSILVMLVGTVTMCGLTNGMSRYFYYPKQENVTVSEVLWSPFIFICFFSLLVLVPLVLVSGSLSNILFDTKQYSYLIILTLVNIFIGNLSSVGRSILVFQEKAVTLNLLNITGIIAGIASGVFMVVFLRRGVTGMIEAGVIGSLIMFFPTLMITLLRFKPSFSLSILIKELKFSLPLVAAVLAFWVIDSSDRYLLKVFLPLSEIGLYDVGYNFGMVMMIIVGGFTLAWSPYYHRHNQTGEGQKVCNSVLIGYLFVSSICAVILSVAAPLLLRLFTTEKFHQAFTVVPLVAIAYMLKGPYLIFLMGILIKNKTSWQLYLEFFAALINIIGNILLIPVIGREAAALTTLCSYSFMCVGAYWAVMRINPIPELSLGFVIRTVMLTVIVSQGAIFFSMRGWNYILSSAFLLMTFFGMLTVTNFKEIKPIYSKITQNV